MIEKWKSTYIKLFHIQTNGTINVRLRRIFMEDKQLFSWVCITREAKSIYWWFKNQTRHTRWIDFFKKDLWTDKHQMISIQLVQGKVISSQWNCNIFHSKWRNWSENHEPYLLVPIVIWMREKGDSTVLKIVHIYRILSPTTFNEKESNKAANAE